MYIKHKGCKDNCRIPLAAQIQFDFWNVSDVLHVNEVFVIKQVGQPCLHGRMETWLYIIQVGYYTFFCLDLICYIIWPQCGGTEFLFGEITV